MEKFTPDTERLESSSGLSGFSRSLGLRALTPARVALRTAGSSLATAEILEFQLAHARARDAVHAALQPAYLVSALNKLGWPADGSPLLVLHSQARDRSVYLQRPDLGRRLDQASHDQLEQFSASQESAARPSDLSIVLVDGLSALAVERHAPPLLAALLPLLARTHPFLRLAPTSILEQGRVAVADEVAMALHAAMVVVLIGERPGLSSPDSLGAYITWNPRIGTSDAERNCISNIRPEGLSYQEAAARLMYFVLEARRAGQTGVALKDPSDELCRSLVQETSDGSAATSGSAK